MKKWCFFNGRSCLGLWLVLGRSSGSKYTLFQWKINIFHFSLIFLWKSVYLGRSGGGLGVVLGRSWGGPGAVLGWSWGDLGSMKGRWRDRWRDQWRVGLNQHVLKYFRTCWSTGEGINDGSIKGRWRIGEGINEGSMKDRWRDQWRDQWRTPSIKSNSQQRKKTNNPEEETLY